jgi:hypothetical protein
MKQHILAAALAVCGLTVAALGQAQTAPAPKANGDTTPSFHDDTWHFALSPYLWMAGMNGTLTVASHSAQVNQSFGDIFSNLKFGFMGLTEARRGRLGILTDLMYIKLGDETAIPIAGLPNALDVKTNISSFTLSNYGAYRVYGNHYGSIDGLVGLRYYHTGNSIDATLPQVGAQSYSSTDNWADVLGGARFIGHLTPKVRAFLVGDAGGGGSDLTYQLVVGGGYQFAKRWSADVAYRKLYFNRQPSGYGLEQSQQGIVIGATFTIK